MRIRKKLIVLHTLFSLVLGAVLLLALRPAVESVLDQAEAQQARFAVGLVAEKLQSVPRAAGEPEVGVEALVRELRASMPEGVELKAGQGERLGVDAVTLALARERPGQSVAFRDAAGRNAAAVVDPRSRQDFVATVVLSAARDAVIWVYVIAALALLGVYALIAIALEVVVLPRHVYGPLGRILAADAASRASSHEHELIPESAMPADELGEIMRSRNQTIEALRRHESELARALRELECAASDLRRKNHLLETARQNLADADRLASLGMMSAGLAHEMNTPLAVIKGLAEKISASPTRTLNEAEAALLLRVIARLERLSESLLDFARARPLRLSVVPLASLVDEAWTLVSLDRDPGRSQAKVELQNLVDPALHIRCDADRMLQVFVNLLRNAVDATTDARRGSPGTIRVTAEVTQREGRAWLSITITDSGSGLDPSILPRLFEPFASTRLDSRGTGLGLAVSEGIVREHGGVIIARNRTDGPGAIFEIMIPSTATGPPDPVAVESSPSERPAFSPTDLTPSPDQG
jgi:signal transduction histidine kinase